MMLNTFIQKKQTLGTRMQNPVSVPGNHLGIYLHFVVCVFRLTLSELFGFRISAPPNVWELFKNTHTILEAQLECIVETQPNINQHALAQKRWKQLARDAKKEFEDHIAKYIKANNKLFKYITGRWLDDKEVKDVLKED